MYLNSSENLLLIFKQDRKRCFWNGTITWSVSMVYVVFCCRYSLEWFYSRVGNVKQSKGCIYAKLETMTFAENSRLMQKNPDTCIIYFNHRLKWSSSHWQSTRLFLQGWVLPERSPHVHMIVWIENAPKTL